MKDVAMILLLAESVSEFSLSFRGDALRYFALLIGLSTLARAADAPIPALLSAAQAKPTIAQRSYCKISRFNEKPQLLDPAYLETDEIKLALKQGYFTSTPKGGQYLFKPTAKYLALLKHARMDSYGNAKYCFGKSQLTALNNVRQVGPDKYTASGVMTLKPEPWATPDVLKIFGPDRNAGVNVPLNLVFSRNGNAWDVEKR